MSAKWRCGENVGPDVEDGGRRAHDSDDKDQGCGGQTPDACKMVRSSGKDDRMPIRTRSRGVFAQ